MIGYRTRFSAVTAALAFVVLGAWTPTLAQCPDGSDAVFGADGLTDIAIEWYDYFNLYGTGMWKLSMVTGTGFEDGSVSASEVGARAREVTVPVTYNNNPNSPDYQHYTGYAYYRVPDEFSRGAGDATLAQRTITVRGTFTPDSGPFGPVSSDSHFDLVRPPVVFVHGLWSGPSTWKFDMANTDATLLMRYRADYSGPAAAASFSTNKEVVSDAVQRALTICNKLLSDPGVCPWKCSRVDVVAHSMGGILTRLHAANTSLFRTRSDRYQGNVRKLITLDTPHLGSPLATILSDFDNDTGTLGTVMRALFARIGRPIDFGAVEDLAPGSPALLSLPSCIVPASALVGVGGPNTDLPRPAKAFYEAANLARMTDPDGTFVEPNDLIVGETSQIGGLPTNATDLFGYPSGIHFGIPHTVVKGNTASGPYSDAARALLDTPLISSTWGELPAPSTLMAATSEPRAAKVEAALPGASATRPKLRIQPCSSTLRRLPGVPASRRGRRSP